MDWTFATNDLDVYFVKGDCTYDQLDAGQCEILAYSESRTAKPEKVRLANAPAATYTIFILNLGPGDESASFQIVLSPSLAASAARPTPSGRAFRPRLRPTGQVLMR